LKYKGCKPASTYNAQADLNADNCVDLKDVNLLKANIQAKKTSACKWNATSKMYRKGERGVRDGNRNAVTLGATTLPTGLKVGDSFDYTIQVNANEAQAADGAAVYLNFDPTQLQVNGLQTGQSFDVTLENTFDNDTGEINFAAGVWDNPAPTQTVELVTINLTLLQSGGEQTLAFSTAEDRQTMIAGGGEEVTALSEDGEVVVEPATITPPPTGNYTASGKVFAEVKPLLMPLADATIQIGDQTAVTDKLGHWQIDGLTNGTYTATATKNGHTIPSQQVVINGEDLTFDFGVVYTAYGTLKNDQKQPVAGATITIGDKHTQTDAAGNWKLDGLPAGESTLIASQDGYKFAPEKFVLGDQEPNKEILVTPASTLVLKAKPSPWQAIRQGENVTYTYTLFNAGSQTATGVTFTETLPNGAKLVSLKTNDGGDCQADTLTCTLPNLTAGATAQVEVVLQATDGKSFKNTATASATEYPADVQTSYKMVKPHLSVTVTDSPDPVVMLTDLHYTATVELSPLAPEDTAKDINLVMQLPKGLELKAVTAATGTCDSSQFPLISCQLPNLSIASPVPLLDKEGLGVVSQTAVNVDVTLKDAGFLVLNNEAKVTASNYPAHTVREKTNIFIPDTIKIDMVLVIDTTNSMQPEINGLKATLDQLITDVPAGQRPTMALIEFKDDVRVKAFTQDTEVMLGAVAKLVAEGGGTCPEASAEALEVALKHLKDGGTILLATDASPYPEANLENLAALIKSQNMKFNVLITGDCTKAEDVNEMTK